MSLYDQNIAGVNANPWYGPKQPNGFQSPQPQPQPQNTTGLSQFAWITNPGVVDMWPIAAGSEMTFIDGEKMMLYVKKVDEYNHPLKTRKFRLTEIVDEEEGVQKPSTPSFDMEELKSFISNEVNRSVSNHMSNMFSFKGQPEVAGEEK